MSIDIKDLKRISEELLKQLGEDKNYTSSYVVSRFEKAALQHPTDQLIGNMRDVLTKLAAKQEFLSQEEIGDIYDQMLGLAGGQTAFRVVLGDLLPPNRQFKKVAYSSSKRRTCEERGLEPIYRDSELSDAFSVLFSLGNDSSFGTYHPEQDGLIEKIVVSKLNRLNCTPSQVKLANRNEHFALCYALYDTPSFDKVAVALPVQISNGLPREPEVLIDNGKTIPLDEMNLRVCLKAQEKESQQERINKMASLRNDGRQQIEIEKAVVPQSLERYADLENQLVAAASKFSVDQINLASNVLALELMSFGAVHPNIKIASSDQKTIIFDAFIPTQAGPAVIHVPVEMPDGKPVLPNKFAVDAQNNERQIFDFNLQGYQEFVSNLKSSDQTISVARETGELSKMSYAQLMDRMLEGVATQDYKLSEDALSVIQSRFGVEQFKVALDKFSQLLKHSATHSTKRKEFIKAAIDRGELIKIPTSVELYSPKLGLPLSKVSFDERGRLIPKGRKERADMIQDVLISTSKIVLT